eukprot:GHVT01075842.1.p1 GENE.GHVT01075842.1~~GHVT01075842.1.p1  ORF type:complete len:140 (+),score=24.89 GHVT01075842.1:305-724(+)
MERVLGLLKLVEKKVWCAFSFGCVSLWLGTHFLIHADLPGMHKEDVKVDLRDHALTISGKSHEHHHREGSTPSTAPNGGNGQPTNHWWMQERCQSSFHRNFALPENVKEDQITANFDNGVLEVKVPKDEKAATKAVRID